MEFSVLVAFCVVTVFLACTAVVSVFLAYGCSQPANVAEWTFTPSPYQPMPMLTRRPGTPEAPAESAHTKPAPVAVAA